MLKLIYTEAGIVLESVTGSLNDWLTTRVTLSIRTGHRIVIESSTATLLLPADLPGLTAIATHLDLDVCDADTLEVSLPGIWVASDPESGEGVLIADVDPDTELAVFDLWKSAQTCLMS